VKFMTEKKKSSITLSPFGRNKQQLTLFTKTLSVDAAPSAPTATPPFDWNNALIDGGIIAGVTFFTTLGGATIARATVTTTIISAAISAAAQFFVMLAIKRGLRK
jgi:hypothetical protein